MTAGECLFWPERKWRSLQAERLGEHLLHAAASPLYRDLLLRPGFLKLSAENLGEVLGQLPLTTKDQLAAAGKNAWAIRQSQVREFVCTSGTAGRPLDVPLSESDLERLAENEADAFVAAGVQAGDLLVLAVALDRMFVAGLAYWLGAQKLGLTAVRAGSSPGALADVLDRLEPDPAHPIFVVGVPSLLASAKVPRARLSGIIAIGEAVRTQNLSPNILASLLQERFGCPVLSTYASTETCTTFAEGPACCGGHLNPRLAVVEILDDAGRPLHAGQVGEVVVTPLGVRGLPLLRFRTGDMAALFTDACRCGRTTPRLGPILGRRQQLLKLRGASLYPAAILEAVRTFDPALEACVVAERDGLGADRVTVFLAYGAGKPTPAVVEGHLVGLLRVAPEVRFVSSEELAALQPRASRKIQRFVDRR